MEYSQEHQSVKLSWRNKQNYIKWSESEHRKFVAGLELFGHRWKKVALHVGNKSLIQVKSKFYQIFEKDGEWPPFFRDLTEA